MSLHCKWYGYDTPWTCAKSFVGNVSFVVIMTRAFYLLQTQWRPSHAKYGAFFFFLFRVRVSTKCWYLNLLIFPDFLRQFQQRSSAVVASYHVLDPRPVTKPNNLLKEGKAQFCCLFLPQLFLSFFGSDLSRHWHPLDSSKHYQEKVPRTEILF